MCIRDRDEATLLRIEHFARTELMSITHGNPAAVDEIVVDEIRCRMKEQSYQEGLDKGKKEAGEEAKKFIQIKRNKACKRAETEIDDEYAKKEIKGIRTIKIVAVVIALCFVCASIYSFINSVDGKISYALLLITCLLYTSLQMRNTAAMCCSRKHTSTIASIRKSRKTPVSFQCIWCRIIMRG